MEQTGTALFGRADEGAFLLADARRALRDGATAVIVAGDAGVGKSRLIAEHLRGTPLGTSAAGRCPELGACNLPYAPFAAALRRLPGGAALFAGGAEPVGPEAPARLFEGVLALLEDAAADGGLTLVLEDLHWSDASTRDLLAFLIANLAAAPVQILATVRTDDLHRTHPMRRLLPEFERLTPVSRLDLAPLGRDAVAGQAAALLGAPLPSGDLDLLYARTGGNPLFVESLLALPEHQRNAVPPGPRELLLGGLGSLEPGPTAVLRAAALSGEQVDHALLESVCGLPGHDFDAAVRTLVDTNALRADSDGYAFRHALLAEAVQEDLLPGERVRLHRRYADALEAPGSAELRLDPHRAAVLLAHHAGAAHDLPRALTGAWRAAEAAHRAAAPPERLALLEQVLELWEQVPDAAERTGAAHVDVLCTAAEAALDADHPQRSQDYADSGLRLYAGVRTVHRETPSGPAVRIGRLEHGSPADPGQPAEGAGPVERAFAALLEAADPATAIAAARPVGGTGAAPVPEHPDPVAVARLLYARGQAARHMSRDGALEDFAEALSLLPGGHPLRPAITAAIAATLALRGHAEQASRLAERAIALARSAGDSRTESDALVTHGVTLSDAGRTGRALDTLRCGVGLAREYGYAAIELRGLNNTAAVLADAARFAESEQASRDGLRRAEELGMSRSDGPAFLLGLAFSLFRSGRLAEAETLARSVPAPANPRTRARWHGLLADITQARGAAAAARRELDAIDAVYPQAQAAPIEFVHLHMVRSWIEAAAGRADEAAADVIRLLSADQVWLQGFERAWVLLEAASTFGPFDHTPDGGVQEPRSTLLSILRDEVAREGTREPARPWLQQWALRCVRAAVVSDPAAAAAEWDAVRAEMSPVHMRLWLPPVLTGRARAAFALGEPAQGAALLAEAHRAARKAGAGRFLTAVAAELERRGLPIPAPESEHGAAPAGAPPSGESADGSGAPGAAPAPPEPAVAAISRLPQSPAVPLTPREQEVLRLVAQGRTNKEIAAELVISVKTVSVHVSHVLEKLGVANRNAAARKARDSGMD